MTLYRFARVLGAALLLVPSLALGQAALQQPATSGPKPDIAPVAINKLYANDVFLQGLIAARFNALGAAALLNVGAVTGTVADGGALAAEILRAQSAESNIAGNVAANVVAIANETSRAQNVEALKAPLASPNFTGVPTVPTAPLGSGTNQIANMAAVAAAVAAGGGGGGGGTGGVPTSRQILTSGLATGGGDLTADRTVTVPKATQSDVAAGTDDTRALTSYSVAAALGAKASLASPALVGTPTAPTAAAGTSTTQIATTGFVAGALGPYVTASVAAATYAPLASPALTGSPTAPTQAAGDNSTKLATTGYADRAVAAVPAMPSGAVSYFAMSSCPATWGKANGVALSRTTYSSLFAAIGTTFGSGDGSTTFNPPDMRGYFPRGFDDGRGVDAGRTFGSTQADQNLAHGHGTIGPYLRSGGGTYWVPNDPSQGYLPMQDVTQTVTSSGGSEARPKNIALLACIKY